MIGTSIGFWNVFGRLGFDGLLIRRHIFDLLLLDQLCRVDLVDILNRFLLLSFKASILLDNLIASFTEFGLILQSIGVPESVQGVV